MMRIYWGKVTETDSRIVFSIFIGAERVGHMTAHEDHFEEIKARMLAEFIHQPRDPNDMFHLGPPLTPEEIEQRDYDLDRLGP